MVHHGNNSDPLHVLERSKSLKTIWRRDFAAQMYSMLSAQPVCFCAMLDCLRKSAHIVASQIGIIIHAATKCVKNGGDARGSDLRVMCLNRRHWIPANAGSRRIMLLQVIRVKLYQARNKVVTVHVFACPRCTSGNLGNNPISDNHASPDNLIGQDNSCIAQDYFNSHQAKFLLSAVLPRECIAFTKKGCPLSASVNRVSAPMSIGSRRSGLKIAFSVLSILSASDSGTLPVSVIWKRKSSKT